MNLVSREKAIDVAIDEYNRGYKEGFEAGKASVPGGGDLISRKEAIDVAKQHWYKPDVAKALEELPSAQPEIIRCKDCKWCEDADGLMCKNTASWVVATDYDFGCVLAERRQDD